MEISKTEDSRLGFLSIFSELGIDVVDDNVQLVGPYESIISIPIDMFIDGKEKDWEKFRVFAEENFSKDIELFNEQIEGASSSFVGGWRLACKSNRAKESKNRCGWLASTC